jgi:hypothetical protein
MKKILSTTLFLTTAILAQQASAKGSFGVNGGWGFFSEDLPEATWNGGLSLEFMVGNQLSVGAFGNWQAYKAMGPASIANLSYGGLVNFHLGKFFYLGANGGMGMTRTTVASSTTTNSDPFVGGQAGIDFMISSSMTAGVEGRYLYIFSDPTKVSLIQALGTLKFNF